MAYNTDAHALVGRAGILVTNGTSVHPLSTYTNDTKQTITGGFCVHGAMTFRLDAGRRRKHKERCHEIWQRSWSNAL